MTIHDGLPIEDILITMIDDSDEETSIVCPEEPALPSKNLPQLQLRLWIDRRSATGAGWDLTAGLLLRTCALHERELRYSAQDLGAAGYGHGWGHTRIYANQLSHAADMGQGPYWLVKEWRYLIEKDDEIVYDAAWKR